MKRVMQIGAIGGAILTVYGLIAKPDTDLGMWGVVVILICLAVLSYNWNKEKKTEKETLDCYLFYDKQSGTLTVKGRDAYLQRILNTKNVISIQDDQNYTTHVTPEKIHFGSVTVGGVTTGGAYKTGGDRVIDGHYKTGLCYLQYNDALLFAQNCTQGHIRKIVLMPSVLKAAKESPIKQYLSGDTIIVEQSSNMSLNELRLAAADPASVTAQSAVKRGYPTREKCVDILNWLKSY